MCEELIRRTDDYLSKLVTVKSYIEEKKSDLDAAMKIAKELRSAPSLRTYCDLTQVMVMHQWGLVLWDYLHALDMDSVCRT